MCLTVALSLVACARMVDYAKDLKMVNSTRKRMTATVKTYIDGDTTHFYVQEEYASQFENGVLKARYLGIDTPESTGLIEPYGKQASNFTHDALESVDANDPAGIILESNDSNWNADSTGTRYLVYVWYRKSANADYRLLNLEIMQNGLALSSSIEKLCYYSFFSKAYNNAMKSKLKMYSGERDELFYYGGAIKVSLKELRTNIEKYKDAKVAFECVVSERYGNGLYVEAFDEEDGVNYGMYVYYGFGLSGLGIQAVRPGNKLRLVGNVQYYEAGNSYQISNIQYNPYAPADDDTSFTLLGTGNPIPYTPIDAATFNGKKVVVVNVDGNEVSKEFKYAELILGTSVSMENLKVVDCYTTKKGNNTGAISLTCETTDGQTIYVRTTVLYVDDDPNGELLVQSMLNGRTINVKGVVDYYQQDEDDVDSGKYQIKVSAYANIEIL